MTHNKSLPKVVLTDPINPEAQAILETGASVVTVATDLSPEEAIQAIRTEIKDAQGLMVRRQLPPDLLETPNDLRAIVRHGVGVDFIPVDAASRHGIPVANVPGANANAVAEYAISVMLENARRLVHFDRQLRDNNWGARREAGATTFDLRGRTVGIVGFGAIGKRVAEIATAGFGMQAVAHTRTPSSLPANIAAMSLEGVFESSDFVVLACPLTDQTRGMINGSVLSRAKPGLVIVNVARGPVINEADLIEALESGKVAGAALDVYSTQPLPMDSPLRRLPQVLLTPHLAGMTSDAERAIGLQAANTMLALLRGERPATIVNPECFDR